MQKQLSSYNTHQSAKQTFREYVKTMTVLSKNRSSPDIRQIYDKKPRFNALEIKYTTIKNMITGEQLVKVGNKGGRQS